MVKRAVLSHGHFYKLCEKMKTCHASFVERQLSAQQVADEMSSILQFPVSKNAVDQALKMIGKKLNPSRLHRITDGQKNNRAAIVALARSHVALMTELGKPIPPEISQLLDA